MEVLTNSSNLIIFTSAPTGLGHIRVMDGLIDGLPIGTKYTEVGIQNISAKKIHALGSRIKILQDITEFYQTNPNAEAVVSYFYKKYLKSNAYSSFKYFRPIKDKYPDTKNWIIVSTHFALAHAISAIKGLLEKSFNVKVTLCVIVTDDSPQRVWVVDNADFIFVPSNTTKLILSRYLKNNNVLKVVSFPISPRLSQKLSENELSVLVEEMDPNSTRHTHIDIPVSGAAVQLDYLSTIINSLVKEKFQFTVIGQESGYTKYFFENISKLPYVQPSIGLSSRETVSLYESIFYQPIRPAIEITKPSEQAFKMLIPPGNRGGVIVLLTTPIGRQEHDNLNFFTRHLLIPNSEEQKELELFLLENKILSDEQKNALMYKASHWRGLRLPENPIIASKFIVELKKSGIFQAMLSYVSEDKEELQPNGVEQVWKAISDHISAFYHSV